MTVPEDGTAELRHTLRTPLNHIVGYAEILREEREAPVANLIRTAREMVRFLEDEFRAEDGLRGSMEPLQRALEESLAELGKEGIPGAAQDIDRIRSAVQVLHDFVAGKPLGEPASRATSAPALAVEERAGNLLVIDDSSDNRDILRRQLEHQGYAVTTASDGAEGLALLRTSAFDLVLLDVLMPAIDGFEMLSLIQADEDLRQTPVLMISALDEAGSVARCIEMGAADYLMKPFEARVLGASIVHAIEKRRRTAADSERGLLAVTNG